MRFSRFELRGRLKQQIRFQTAFLSTSHHSNQTKATHRHTHVGSTAGKTIIRSGGDTTLKGAQLIGKGVQADTRNLHIESVQDSETYQGKQQNAGAQVTVGYGFSASGSYSQSKIRADHASVNEQSGIYAGEDGYQINVGNHTDLKGGIITSTQSAEDKGKNRFQTATLTHSDIQNHSRYEGESFGLGASVAVSGKTLGQGAQNKPQDKHLTSVADKNSASSSVGYGSDSDSQSSITKSGINTQNIQITDEAAQIRLTGKIAAQTKADIDTNVTTDTAERHSGSLKNVFDKDRVQSELDLQRTVSQDFSKNVQQANTEINRHLDKLKADKEAAETAAAEALANGDMETAKRKAHEAQDAAEKADNWQQSKVILNMLASGLAAPTQSGVGIAAATASPAVSYAIGQHFKDLAGQNANGKLTASQETAHVLAHVVLGAAVAAAAGNNAPAGALSAGGSEAAAPYISKWLYGKEKGSDLTAEEKETVSAITNLLGTATGAVIGDTTANAAQGSLNAQSAVGNNGILDRDGFTPDERIQRDFLSSCIKLSSRQECQKRFEQNQQENIKVIILFMVDFVLVIGDMKGFAEAKTKGDYFFAAMGVILLYGDALKKVHQAEKAYEAAKAAGNTQKMVEAMQDARKGADLPYEPQKIRTELEKRYEAENITSTTAPRKPQQSVNNQNKSDYTSTVTSNLSGKSVRLDYKDPVSGKSLVANIAYDSRGLPIFDNVAKFTTRLDTSLSTTGQMRAATRSLRDAIEKGVIPKSNFTSTQLEDIMAGKRTINGYIWHHNAQSVPNNMQLVPLEIHDAVRHTGQNALKKGH